MSPFFIALWFLQPLTDFYNIWHIVYRVNLQHNNFIDLPASPTTYVLLLLWKTA